MTSDAWDEAVESALEDLTISKKAETWLYREAWTEGLTFEKSIEIALDPGTRFRVRQGWMYPADMGWKATGVFLPEHQR